MEEVSLKGHAKINIALDVMHLRDDGYHEVKMIMASLALADKITLTKRDNSKISLDISDKSLPVDSSNLAVKAAKELLSYLNEKKAGTPPDYKGLHISIKKNIPAAAGLAGGSSDAAAVIRGMNILYNLNLDLQQQFEIAGRIGSDVPFCIYEKPALATGRGEIITPLAGLPEVFILLVKPNFDVSTSNAYYRLDCEINRKHPDIDSLCDLINAGSGWDSFLPYMENSFEPAAIRQKPIIKSLKDRMEGLGALKALMSGSGPSVYGIFTDEGQAEFAYDNMRKEFKDMNVFLTRRL